MMGQGREDNENDFLGIPVRAHLFAENRFRKSVPYDVQLDGSCTECNLTVFFRPHREKASIKFWLASLEVYDGN